MNTRFLLCAFLLSLAFSSCQSAYRTTRDVDFHKKGFSIQEINKYGGRLFIVSSYLSRHHYLEITQQAKWDRKLKRDIVRQQKKLRPYTHVSAAISNICADYTASKMRGMNIKRPVSMTRIGVDKMVAARVGTRGGIDGKKYLRALKYMYGKVMRKGDVLLIITYSDYIFKFEKKKALIRYGIKYQAKAMRKISGRHFQKITSVSGKAFNGDYIEGRYRGTLAGYINRTRRVYTFRNAVMWATFQMWKTMVNQ